jgi:hypothetical protein
MLNVGRVTACLTSIIQNVHLMLLWFCLRMFWKECMTLQSLKSAWLDFSRNETVLSVQARAEFALNVDCSQNFVLERILCICLTP